MKEYTNSEIRHIIMEHVHKQRDRDLLLRRYIDGICFEPLAEEFGISVKQAKNIVYKYQAILLKHLV